MSCPNCMCFACEAERRADALRTVERCANALPIVVRCICGVEIPWPNSEHHCQQTQPHPRAMGGTMRY